MPTIGSAGCGHQRLEVLAINKHSQVGAVLRSILGHTNWVYHSVPDVPKAMLFLKNHFVPVILCSKDLPDATWRDVVAAMGRFPIPPKVLVYSEHADDALWLEVLNSGGYDLLTVPFNSEEVLRLISLACRKWKDDAKRLKQSVKLKAAS